MTNSAQPAKQDIQFIADHAAARGEKLDENPRAHEALFVLLSALGSDRRFNPQHDRERAELLASIRTG